MADWQAIHPPRHWKAGYSAMEMARCWHAAGGLPPKVADTLGRGGFSPLTIRRGIAECKTPVPGEGRASQTDLMVEATDEAGALLVLGVEGKVNESFGPEVGAWLAKVDNERSRLNKIERLAGLMAGLGLVATIPEIAHLRYQLLHRTFAALAHARKIGAGRAILVVHSFASGADLGNRADFALFLGAMGAEGGGRGTPTRIGDRNGVELWAVWVSDAPVES